jgi:hypothetical protein
MSAMRITATAPVASEYEPNAAHSIRLSICQPPMMSAGSREER